MSEKRRTTITLPERIYDEIDDIIENREDLTHRNEVVEEAIEYFNKDEPLYSDRIFLSKYLYNDMVFLVAVEDDDIIYLTNSGGDLEVKRKSLKSV